MNANEQLIDTFYLAFQKGDWQGMQNCYTDDVEFSDAVFVGLKGKRARAMWHMLAAGAKNFQLSYNNVKADDTKGSCHWEARYTFSATGRPVHNVIDAEFEFRNGKISKHTDHFSFYKWSRQALGIPGQILGWTGFFKKKLRSSVAKRLDAFIAKHPEYQ